MIEPIRKELSSGIQADIEEFDKKWRKRIKEVILESDVKIKVELGKTEITGERLIYMQEDDIIQLDNDVNEPLIGYVNGLEKLKGSAGVQRGQQSLKIEEKIMIDFN